MDQKVRLAMLLDLYGSLLTQRQRESLSLHIEEDLSYAEIAQELGVSRQGAADAASVAKEQLLHFEEKLGLLSRTIHIQQTVEQAVCQLTHLEGTQEVRRLLQSLYEEEQHGL